MSDKEILSRKEHETTSDYINRVCALKSMLKMTWTELANIINEQCGLNYDESTYRKNFAKSNYSVIEQDNNILDDETKQMVKSRAVKMQMSDERVQLNAFIRRLSREDTIKEIAHDFAMNMSSKKILEDYSGEFKSSGKNQAILELSDWHYGIEVDSFWNRYNTDIAKARISRLLAKTIQRCKRDEVSVIHVVNLADLICGRIHLTLRLQSRIDVITQIMEVSEILAEFLNKLTQEFEVHYYDCLDNHSRIEPNKKDSLSLETLARITPWYLKERLADNKNITVHANKYAPDIITFKCLDWNILGVHGDKDKPQQVVDNMSLMTHSHYDLILTAHQHHFACDEKNDTVVISNGSLMGTDDYAEKLRLSSTPSQNLIIVTKETPCDSIYRIVLK